MQHKWPMLAFITNSMKSHYYCRDWFLFNFHTLDDFPFSVSERQGFRPSLLWVVFIYRCVWFDRATISHHYNNNIMKYYYVRLSRLNYDRLWTEAIPIWISFVVQRPINSIIIVIIIQSERSINKQIDINWLRNWFSFYKHLLRKSSQRRCCTHDAPRCIPNHPFPFRNIT